MSCGVAVVVTHQQQVLFGRRKSGLNGFEWQLPGGWIDAGESPQQAARREVIEETSLQLQNLRFVGLTSNVFSTDKHSISLYFEAECIDAQLLNVTENDKCFVWEWRNWVDLSANLYLPLRLFKQTGYQPFSKGPHWTHVSI